MIWIVTVVVLAALGWYFLGKGNSGDISAGGTKVNSGMPVPNADESAGVVEKIVSIDTSDATLDQSLAFINAQISQLGIDTVNVSNSLDDEPISQAE